MKVDEIYHSYMYSYPHKAAYRPLEGIRLEDYKKALYEEENTLYIHIPFCQTKCGYCNLFSVTGRSQEEYGRYLSAVEEHARQLDIKDAVWTNFIVGGGTPMILNEDQLERLFMIGEKLMNVDLKEVSSCVETAPNQTDPDKLKILKAFHVDRVSIGIQSFHDRELKLLKRSHTQSAAVHALERIKKEEFLCLNIDLIYGIPGQTVQDLAGSIKAALEFEPDEIYAYPLYIRQNANLGGYGRNREMWSLYCYLRDRLMDSGYIQTSMRCFTKKRGARGESCGFENTVSLGCGGRSYLGDLHFCSKYETEPCRCVQQIEDYIKLRDKTAAEYGIILNKSEQKRRFVIKNLLHSNGIDVQEYLKRFEHSLTEDFTLFEDFLSRGWCVEEEDRMRLTPLGMSLSDHIGPMFISDEIRCRMEEYF